MSEQNHSQNNNRNSNRHHGQNRNNRPQQSNGNRTSAEKRPFNQNSASGSNRPNGNNNRKRNNRRNRYRKPNPNPGLLPQSEKRPPFLDRAYEKYQNLLDQHLIARKKYFELFFRADPQQKAKLERNFYQTLMDLRDFEEKATPEVKEFLNVKTNGKKEDYIYSEGHALEKIGQLEVTEAQIEDPHFLPSQAKADYTNDTEESVGTLEDYQKYKGI